MFGYYYVYILVSERHPGRPYIGVTQNLSRRLAAHNAGQSPYTARYRPWKLRAAIALPTKDKALAFERYLKTHSGRAFAKRHL
jgi:predicted GIY-YIG superfamily endonuclease